MVMVMAVERSWDVYEIALLIELYLDIQEGKTARSEGVQKLSGVLRQRARTLGYEVGARFRNINGVSFMLSSLTQLFTDGKRGSIKPPQIFKQTYKLYKTDRSRFAATLRIAHEQCAKEFTPKLLQFDKDIRIKDSVAVDAVKEKKDKIQLNTVNNYANNNHEGSKELSASGNKKPAESANSDGTPVTDLVSEQLKFLNFCASKHTVQIKTLAHYIVRLNNFFLDKKIIKQGVFSEQDLEALKALKKNDNWKALLGEAFTGGSLLLASLYFFYLLEYLEAGAMREPVAGEVQEKPQAENVSASDGKPSAAPVESVIDEEKETAAIDAVGNPADSYASVTSQAEPAVKNEEYVSTQKEEPAFINEEYASVLQERFSKGFRMESSLEIRKFRRYYAAQFGKELADSDELITRNIKRLCILYAGKAFLPAVMLSEELKEKLLHYIEESFASGKKVIYFQALYNHFAQDFLDYPIHDADMLRIYLEHLHIDGVFITYDFISKERYVVVDPVAEIRQCLQEYARPVEYEEVFAALPHIPQSNIKYILNGNREFVNNGGGAYFHESSLMLSHEELENIAAIIDYYIQDKEFMGGNELYEAVKAKYPDIIDNNAIYSVNGFRDALKYKLGERFYFKGNVISRYGNPLSMTDVFANYAKRHDSFTLTELQALAGELATGIYFEPVYENSLRISREQFVAKSRAHFLVDETDAALDRICAGDYIAIKEITNFGMFPYAGFAWNSFLLEHYAAFYSHKYKLLHCSSFNAKTCVGVIVKKSAGIDAFDDLVVDLLTHTDIELNKASVLQYLSDIGYIAQRKYSNIEALIIKANAQRNRKDTD